MLIGIGQFPALQWESSGNTGQMCLAGSRLFVQDVIYEDFVAAVGEFAGKLRIGDGLDPNLTSGP